MDVQSFLSALSPGFPRWRRFAERKPQTSAREQTDQATSPTPIAVTGSQPPQVMGSGAACQENLTGSSDDYLARLIMRCSICKRVRATAHFAYVYRIVCKDCLRVSGDIEE